MASTWEGTCAWRLQGPDPIALHLAIGDAAEFLKDRKDVPFYAFVRKDDQEQLDVVIEVREPEPTPQEVLDLVAQVTAAHPVPSPREDSSPSAEDMEPIPDPLTRIREEGTHGGDYGLDTEAVVTRLEGWNERQPFDVLAVGVTYVTIRFHELPADPAAWAAEANAFSPDLACDYEFEDDDLEDDAYDEAALKAITERLGRDPVLRLWWE